MSRSTTALVLFALACGPPPPTSYEGTAVRFDLEGAQRGGDDFYAYPYPADARLTARGGPPLKDLPFVEEVPQVLALARSANELEGYPVTPVAWFQVDGALAERDPTDVIAASPDATLLLVDVDPDSPGRGSLVPLVAQTLVPDPYTAEGVLALSPVPGFVLRAGTEHAFVVRRSLGDAAGDPLGAPARLLSLLRGEVDDGSVEATGFAHLGETLDTLGVDREDVASATVFTTADTVARLHALTEQVRDRYAPEIGALALTDRAPDLPGYCELRGTLQVPEFQAGRPPFDREGLFVLEDDTLVEQRQTAIPVVVALPHGEMPAEGWPLAMYFHGSGGLADQLVARGKRPQGGQAEVGAGPSATLAARGFASAGAALPVNPERVAGASSFAYLNFNNLAAFRDTFRQGVIEQRLFLDALLRLEVRPEQLVDCPGPVLPAGAQAFRFDPDTVVGMGQSMGGMYTNMIGAVEPRIRAVVPTGAGGHWSRFILLTELLGPGVAESLLRSLVQVPEDVPLTFLHPALHTGQTAWEPAEPMIHTVRLARRPLPGHPVRPIYQPVGLGDSYFPPEVFDAMALAFGTEQAGEDVWPGMQDALALDDREGFVPLPAADNRKSEDGTPFTAIAVQSSGDGYSDPHVIFVQVDAIVHQWGCFLQTFREDGVARVPVGAGPRDACR
ncbi:MAG: hypothetical protein H6732_13225 [Alphaproteobacteria bacterium]|nr:hypothetical protein [Alphaproteobacteria bacterium]